MHPRKVEESRRRNETFRIQVDVHFKTGKRMPHQGKQRKRMSNKDIKNRSRVDRKYNENC